ncbi:DNA internalization-related competence protein ComEC/Rec2 [Aliiglaciecola sp. CAU 1673]|uniref:DNA internalization-related competence protein ComEC/Rec2 n=1 Tax=Aliiglaciecola sp. CAU 1673 TaxID=3032595 RepID=UPI0023DAE52F|nr:DNA internalization-related competence protein ComEC/Rec2 [Aliiglaciecola sp. CAU 1673]MDF2179981.1 DNA internalization-related competence protein ComEC/Rec2 [Aliiglaciecola sp. CAU 1673]
MDVWVCSFITACISALFWPHLPPGWSLGLILFLSLTLLRYRRFLLSGLLAGILWMASVGYWQFAWQLQPSQQGVAMAIEGHVDSLISSNDIQRFNFRVKRLGDEAFHWQQPLVRLSWRDPDFALKQGQRLKLNVKLRPVHASLNEGGFNYQRWAFSSGIRARGYVLGGREQALLENDASLRQQWLDRLLALNFTHSGWLAALSLGYRGLLKPEDWTLVQRTGVAHLIAISGLHLGIVGGLAYATSAFLLGRLLVHRPQHINFHRLALLVALVLTFGYAAVAGFGLPTLRAWLMLALVTSLLLLHQSWPLRRLFLYSFFAFMLLFPLSLFGISLWLSFSAILIIWLVFWRFPVVKARFSLATAGLSMLRVQIALSLLMMPLVAWQFGVISVISPLVNFIAVPLVTLLLVPLCLLGLLFLMLWPAVARWILSLADIIVDLGIRGLVWFSSLPVAAFPLKAVPLVVWLLAAIALIIFLLPPLPKGRWWAALLCLPLLSWMLPSKPSGWFLHVLDVGQGLSVVIQRQDRAIVYDTGPAYGNSGSAAQYHLLPFLQAKGINALDHLIISHHDNDHDGGLDKVQEVMPVRRLWGVEKRCPQGWQGEWMGLSLSFLWPPLGLRGEENNQSCVVLIDDGQVTALLPGDIEASAESALLAEYGQQLNASILIAPHHGSNTSSSQDFIENVKPAHVVFSQGYANRWGFPTQQVLERYQSVGASPYQTSELGQVTFAIDGGAIQVQSFRQDIVPYWYMKAQQNCLFCAQRH